MTSAQDQKIVGRFKEIEALKTKYHSKKAEFIAVYGRRRVGKTFLIREFFKQQDGLLFQLTGIHNAKLATQLKEFKKELEALYAQLGIKLQLAQPKNWLEALEALTEAIKHSERKIVLFFDELPWMAHKKSTLLEALDYYWNRYWVDNANVKLIICGSAASWIIKNVLNNRGGLHNRVTLRLLIEPFTLAETEAYLKSQGVRLSHAQILQLYMCIGGVPFYLASVQPGLSAAQNINELCFQKTGVLSGEFNNLFSSLFSHSNMHETIVKLLATKKRGMSRKEIAAKTAYQGGGLTRILKELEHAGFIESFISEARVRGFHYKLIDEYSLFYLSWVASSVKPKRLKEMNTRFWEEASQSSAFKAWAGYAFEAICFKHLKQIRKALKIPEGTGTSTWQYIGKKSDTCSGAQIDLLFDRNDGIINICEIKYSVSAYKIDKSDAQNLQNKIEVYKKITQTKKQLVLSMIAANGLAPSVYREGLVWSQVTAEDLFKP